MIFRRARTESCNTADSESCSGLVHPDKLSKFPIVDCYGVASTIFDCLVAFSFIPEVIDAQLS